MLMNMIVARFHICEDIAIWTCFHYTSSFASLITQIAVASWNKQAFRGFNFMLW